MTKQQAISLKLAQWLGYDARVGEDCVGYYLCFDGDKTFVHFNPFSATTEGRAQFAECVIKATQSGFDVHMMNIASRCYSKETMHGYRYHTQDTSPDAVVTATLEAIYYAIGGTADNLEERPKSGNHEDGDYSYLCGRDYCRCTQ